MNEELQGEGTYTYECKEPGCWYCVMIGLKPNVPAYPPVIAKPVETVSKSDRQRIREYWGSRERRWRIVKSVGNTRIRY